MTPTTTAEKPENFGIYCMSMSRWDSIMTKRLFEYCTYVVREEQAEKYRAAGVDDLLIIPAGAVHPFSPSCIPRAASFFAGSGIHPVIISFSFARVIAT